MRGVMHKNVSNYSVYSKGFKGVPDRWYNIQSCNFLLGENSCGKSSFLQLLELIDSKQYMMHYELCGVVKGLDTAIDICSRISNTKTVTIGYLITEKIKEGGGLVGRLTSYKQSKGKLLIDRVTFLKKDVVIRFKVIKGGFGYRVDYFGSDDHHSHVEAEKKFDEMHCSKGRFKRVLFEGALEAQDPSVWMQFFMDEKGEDRSVFPRPYPPLKVLHYGPSRARPKRLIYGGIVDFSSSGEHQPYVMRHVMSKNKGLRKAIKKFGEDSGLFDDISITSFKTKANDEPFAIQVKKAGQYFYIDELGYGVGQVLPIVTDIAYGAGTFSFLIQQPELHLHPRAQAAFGDLLANACAENFTLIVETHSDYVIDRFRIKSKQIGLKQRSQIIYFYKGEDEKNCACDISILPDGTLSGVPEFYREFFMKETIDKIGQLS